MKTILDVLRWIFALIILYLISNYALTSLLYVFEFIFTKLSGLKPYLYWIIIFPGLTLTFFIFTTLLILLIRFIIKITVRQPIALSILFGILFAIGSILTIILIWTEILSFSWQNLPYSTLNKILFTFFIGGLAFQVPYITYLAFKSKYSQKLMIQ